MAGAGRGSRRAGNRTPWLAFALFALTSCIAFLPTGEAARFTGTVFEPVSWSFLAKFCFLPADSGGYVNAIHGMVSTKIKFHVTSQFSVLHYVTADGAAGKESSTSLANWEDVYKSKSTCLDRVNNKFAFPFYLAELARAALPAPPPPSAPSPPPVPETAGGRRRLSSAEARDDSDARSGRRSDGFDAHVAAFYETSLFGDEPYVEVPLRYFSRFDAGDADDSGARSGAFPGAARTPGGWRRRRALQDAETAHGTYDADADTTTYVINGQTIVVDGNKAGSNTAWGLGLIDITRLNVADAYTNLPLDNSAKLRVHAEGWVEVIRTTFYVGDRARFFYVVGANCDRLCKTSTCNGDLNIEYEIVFTNGFKWYSKHFSADQIGILETSVAFCFLYFFLGIGYCVTRRELKKVRKHHHTVKMLGSSIFLAFFSHAFFFLHYIWFSSDGVGYAHFVFLARCLQGTSETIFLVLLVLLAKGWTVCCRKISARGRVKIAVFATVYAASWLLAVAYHHFSADKASTLHVYQSGFGYFLCGCRLFGLGWFWYSVAVTNKKYHAKVHFYKKFALSFAPWFYGLPVVVIVAHFISPWRRFVVVNALEFTFAFAFQLVLLMMYVPNSEFNKSFPFHATTNETFLRDGRPSAVRASTRRSTTQRPENARQVAVGPSSRGSGNADRGALSDWDKRELARAVHSARVLTLETKKILDCLTQIEHDDEKESDDEAYDEPRATGNGGDDVAVGVRSSTRAPNASSPPTLSPTLSPSGREYGTGAYPAANGGGSNAPEGYRRGIASFGSDARDQTTNPTFGDPAYFSRDDGAFGWERLNGGNEYGVPVNNPVFVQNSSANAARGGSRAVSGSGTRFPPPPPISPSNGHDSLGHPMRRNAPPSASSSLEDVANQRSLSARLGKNRGMRPLGSGGYI